MSANRQTDLPSRLEAWFRTRAGAEERLTFPVHANLGAVVKFERLAPVPGHALCTPTAASWTALRKTCELAGAFSWAPRYDGAADRADRAEWSVEIDWPDREVRSRGRGAFPPLTPDAPPIAALLIVCSALSRLADSREVFGRAARRRPRKRASVSDEAVQDAVRSCAVRLRRDDRRLEVRLDSALSEGLHRAGAAECARGSAELPGWRNPKSSRREIDVLVDGVAFEQKVDDIDQQLWDAVKLVSMLCDGTDIRGAYLVAWAPWSTFDRAPSGVLYRSAGTWEIGDLVARMPSAWQKCLADGNNEPLQTPARFRTQRVAREACWDGYEIRAIRLDLVGEERLRWNEGKPQAAPSFRHEDVTLTVDDLIDAWAATLTPRASWWHQARHEAYAAVSGLDLRDNPNTLSGDRPSWFAADAATRGEHESAAFWPTPDAAGLPALLRDAARVLAPMTTPFTGYLEWTPEIAAFAHHFDPILRSADVARTEAIRALIRELIEVIYGPQEAIATSRRDLVYHGFDPRTPEPVPGVVVIHASLAV